MRLSYILPIKWDAGQDTDEITGYLAELAAELELIVVDGSNPVNFQLHNEAWAGFCQHLPPAPEYRFVNGKVNGVMTGLNIASFEKVVIADDDVRYTLEQLREMEALLDEAELVVPQNYFSPAPWHAQWDSARTLLNRALHHDYPGTLAVQRNFINQLGGYDGNVLFENLELMRTIHAAYGRVVHRPDIYVERLPPTSEHFWSQRVRQAYDDYAQPLKLAFFFVLMPVLFATAVITPVVPIVLLALSIPLAELGRRLHGGTTYFPLACSFYAPCWLLERGICTWLAMFAKLRNGGVFYNNRVISVAANPIWKLRSKLRSLIMVNGLG